MSNRTDFDKLARELIARIHELEVAFGGQLQLCRNNGFPASAISIERLLAKGVVLP